MIVKRDFVVFVDGNQIYMEYNSEFEGSKRSLELSYDQAVNLRDKLDDAINDDG